MHAWTDFLDGLEKDLGKASVNKWLRTLRITHFDACNLFLEAKDSFQIMWFEEHIRARVEESLTNNNQKKIQVHLSVAGAKRTPAKGKGRRKTSTSKSPTPPPFTLVFDELDPYATFNHLVFCRGNLIAYKLLCELTGYDPGTHSQEMPQVDLASFNPIYLHGGKGVGKTHLLMATARCLKEMGLRVVYARSETFTEHVVSAIRAGEMRTFRQAYRDIDCLIIDDVHVFSRKGATQEEFFHTFNTLHVEGKQIILSANCAPQELQLIEPRLVSRFEWGIVLGIEGQSKDELRKVVMAKARALKYPLEERVVDFLLETFRSSPTTLAKAVEALILRTHMRQTEGKGVTSHMTVNLASQILQDLIEEEQRLVITPEQIVQTTAEHYGIRVEDILSKAQSRDCVVPRQVAMHLCRNVLGMPFTKIGSLFNRDHSTVMSSCRQVDKQMDLNDTDLLSSVKTLQKKLHSAEPRSTLEALAPL